MEEKDLSGKQKIEFAQARMPVLARAVEDSLSHHSLGGKKVAMTIHLEAKTAVLASYLKTLGADVYVAGSNTETTQDDVAQALAEQGVNVFAKHGCTQQEQEKFLRNLVVHEPDFIIDDGGDLVALLDNYPEFRAKVLGGCEETTTGVTRLKAREKEGSLHFPMIAVNDSPMKKLFDNCFGTGQSTMDGILRTTNMKVCGKNFVVAGYGHCGKGIAMRARGLGANVIVTEVNPVKAYQAMQEGYRVMPMMQACLIGDFFVTATGDINVIDNRHFGSLKDGAILCNAGHFDVEVHMDQLRRYASSHREVRKNIEEFVLPSKKKIFVLAQGKLVNLAAADGHPIEIMDLSFSLQFLSVLYLATSYGKMEKKLYPVPPQVDRYVAKAALSADGVKIDTLTSEQEKYLQSM